MSDGPESEAEVIAERDRHELQRETQVVKLAEIVRRRVDRAATEDDPPLPPAA